MKKLILTAITLALAASAWAQAPKRDVVHGILGDYDAEPRLLDKSSSGSFGSHPHI